ncbi:MAG: CPBP family intramembrane glutamic endopeptidase [Chloroflexota bacterium]
MNFSEIWISLALILIAAGLLVVTGLKKQPGIGIIGTVIVIALAYWLRGDPITGLGLAAPENWTRTILLGLAFGIIIQLIAIILIEPLSEKLTNSAHDHSLVENVKGNWKAFLQWMLMVWVMVAFLEEVVFRGFLLTETIKVLGDGTGALIFIIIFSSLVFGFAHGYQQRAGILSTAIIGAMLAGIFVCSDFNLWLAVFTHGFIDTVGIGLIALEKDEAIRKLIRKGT